MISPYASSNIPVVKVAPGRKYASAGKSIATDPVINPDLTLQRNREETMNAAITGNISKNLGLLRLRINKIPTIVPRTPETTNCSRVGWSNIPIPIENNMYPIKISIIPNWCFSESISLKHFLPSFRVISAASALYMSSYISET